MNVLDASNHLFEWFGANDSFEINKDLKRVLTIIDNEEETISAFKLALSQLEEQGMVCSQKYGDKDYFVLTKPYDAYIQNIELSAFTAKWLAGEINEFCDMIQDNTDAAVASGIVDKDVRNAIHIIQFYKQKMTEKEDIISNLSVGGDINDLVDGLSGLKGDDNSDASGEDKKNNKKKK
jgi:hypothetical protein